MSFRLFAERVLEDSHAQAREVHPIFQVDAIRFFRVQVTNSCYNVSSAYEASSLSFLLISNYLLEDICFDEIRGVGDTDYTSEVTAGAQILELHTTYVPTDYRSLLPFLTTHALSAERQPSGTR
ncbi:hypothetical protein PILCRDRAFT_3549 [Piloderma croceum F 1598]|uniref:Uncharacterized protein n=1 Tax=Piloderma croceum (strain F 1598) TaxID=765440 RepID=A0A0C3GB01_PILCF|nr:hypothetical protein PILCRDRAFT_3549 [Piloderma croceum F 1598]